MKLSDLEGLARRMLEHGMGRGRALQRLEQEIMDFRGLAGAGAQALGEAVLAEVEASSSASAKDESGLLSPVVSGVTMGEQGVGCRGTGDFFVHHLIAQLSDVGVRVALSPQDMDDAGAIEIGPDAYLVVKMEGMHSRLSDFPFLAGFHVTRAALRDLMVKGASPLGLTVDLHLADDADVGKVFDFMAGVACVCELIGCPVLGGSTLRIGGDMVIGTRMTGGVAAVGRASRLFPRRDVREKDTILMTEGAGGGTICTTAIYSGHPDVVAETLNLKFLEAGRVLLAGSNVDDIHCMADVTNGGIRADLHEIGRTCGCGATIDERGISYLVNPKVSRLLKQQGIDYLGVSLDSLLVFCEPGAAEQILAELSAAGVRASVIGNMTASLEVTIQTAGGKMELLPRFRESAYTKIKAVVDSRRPLDQERVEASLRASVEAAKKRKGMVISRIRRA